MKNALMILAVMSILLFAGCASQPVQQPPEQQPVAPVKNETAADDTIPPVPQPPAQEPPAQQAAADTCTVEFQKDSSSIYYIMVKTDSAKALAVKCPNGNDAQKVGELYFCDSLALPSPTIAYLDGVKCGSADFSKSAYETTANVGKASCTVLLAPSRITKGQSSLVTVQAYTTGNNDILTYKCGTEEVSEKFSGSVSTGKNCRYDEPGTVEVYAKVNGEVCSTKLLEVFERAKDCSVLSGSLARSGPIYTYTFKVAARGYSGSDSLRYKCYDVYHVVKLETIKNTADFTNDFECTSNQGPLNSSVEFYVNTDYCGAMAPPEG